MPTAFAGVCVFARPWRPEPRSRRKTPSERGWPYSTIHRDRLPSPGSLIAKADGRIGLQGPSIYSGTFRLRGGLIRAGVPRPGIVLGDAIVMQQSGYSTNQKTKD